MAKKVSRRRFLKTAGAGSVGALLALAGCAPAPQPAPAAAPAAAPTTAPAAAAAPTKAPAASSEPKVLRIRLYSDIANLDPIARVSNNDETVMTAIFSGLVGYKPGTYDTFNDLVEKIEQSDDGKTISFKLKEGVKFQKGYGEVTTEDVKYSFERFLDKNLKVAYKDDWATLDHVEAVDKYNGKIVLKEPFAPLWKTTLPIGSGYIVPKKYVEEVGVEKFATNPIGSGPYQMEEWTPKQKIRLVRNPDYFGTKPYWDEIVFSPIDDDKVAEVALEAGEIDFSRVAASSINRLKDDPKIKLLNKPSLRYRWIGMNIENPKLADPNVRQAIRYAIDVPAIVQATYMGQAEPEYALVPPGLVGYWADAPHYQRDVAKAKELLKKAGVDKLDLRIDIEDTTEYRSWAEIAQQNLAEAGINLTINPMDSSSFWELGSGDKGKQAELFSNNYSMQPDPSWATMWFTCEQIGVWNWQRWCSKEYDDLHKKALVTMDDKARGDMYIQMQKLFDDAAHSIWITHGEMDYGYLPTINPVVSPHGLMQPIYFQPASAG
jgi:peptide/nickel transport system substrate-binding protein